MLAIPLETTNLDIIHAQMNNGVSLEELIDMCYTDLTQDKHRTFISTREYWAFVDSDLLDQHITTLIKLMEG